MKDNPLKKLETFGQSIWLDYIRRDLITSGELRTFDRGGWTERYDLEPIHL